MAHFRSLRPCEFDLWPFVDSITFYRTTHIQHTWCVSRGVRLSVRHKPVFCPSTAHDCTLVFWHKNLAKIPMWSPNAGTKYTLTGKVCDFLPTTRQISETAQLGTDIVCYGKWIRRWYMLCKIRYCSDHNHPKICIIICRHKFWVFLHYSAKKL